MSEEPLYLNPRAAAEVRVRDLLGHMTLEEKVAQLGSVRAPGLLEDRKFSKVKAEKLIGRGIGQITRLSGGRMDGVGMTPREAAEVANEVQGFLLEETRLGIPAIVHEECLSGLMAMNATAFPQIIGLASTWDPELIEEVTSVIRGQMRAVGARQGLSPVLDVARDPRWGRTEETLGEDPYLVARMGLAYIRGLQGGDSFPSIIATPKHFAAHGFSEGGRNCASVHVPPRELREVFLLPFEVAIREAGAGSIMNAYHEIDGIPCAASRLLLTRVLREEWGFRGYVVSDYRSIGRLITDHRVAADGKEAAKLALEAGIDVELPMVDCYGEPLTEAVGEGLVSEATIDEAVYRVLRAKFLLGLFENPYVEAEKAPDAFDTAEHRTLALRAARESIVLLKNDGILPLMKGIKSIAVIGPNAGSTRNLLGDYTYTARLPYEEDAVPVVSTLAGIRKKVSPATEVHHAEGCDISGTARDGFEGAVEAAEKAEVVVAVVGERSGLGIPPSPLIVSGEGSDRASLRLPGAQEDLVKALCEAGKPVILVLVNGRPISLGWIAERCPAILEAWLPGEEGGNAIADVLFGDSNPGGKLPISFPQETGQVPVYYNRRPASFRNYVFVSSMPLFPFGHGLSYTKFEYSNLRIEPERVMPAGKTIVSLNIKNVGHLRGDEVIQLYICDEVASVSRPVKELKAFKRATLEPGEERTVTFTVSTDLLAFHDRHMRFIVEPGTFRVMVGGSSEDIRLSGAFEVVGGVREVPAKRVYFSEATIS